MTTPRLPLNELLLEMVNKGASDVFLCADAPPKMLIQGNFESCSEVVLTSAETEAYANDLLSENEREQFEEEHEANLSYSLPDGNRFRVNIYVQRNTIALVIRQIITEIPTIDELELPQILCDLINKDRGLVLVTGATGSGKSTTVAAMINHRNKTIGGHMITIEDPIEFLHKHHNALISQREVGIDTKSFQHALKNTLRQAPKVIFIGEIRDAETMSFALHASETGHLVLATLHSNNANQTLERIANYFPNDFQQQLRLQLSLNLRAIISQRLVKKTDGRRTAAVEILLDSPLIRELIFKGQIKEIKSAMMRSKNEFMQTFDMHLHQLWRANIITEEEAFRNADSANNLRLQMKGVAISAT